MAIKSLGDSLQDLFKNLGLDKKVGEYRLLGSWSDIVGSEIAQVTSAERIDNLILFVRVQSGPWRNELIMRKGDILRKIRQEFGNQIINDIRFF